MEQLSAFSPMFPRGLTGAITDDGNGVTSWWIANDTDRPLAPLRVRMVSIWRPHGRVRVFCHGYQSWTASGVRVLGVDEDPSRAEGSLELVRGMHNADAMVSDPSRLRSGLVTVIVDDENAVCLGFDGGARHDSTFWIWRLDDGTVRVDAEAFLGSALVAPDTRRALHRVFVRSGDPHESLELWADWAGTSSEARTTAPYQVGWCSWYQYFATVTEQHVRDNLALASAWPVDVFQVDDGYQAAIGDWLTRNEKFPTALEDLAHDIARAGFVPGIWIAPFLAAPDSELARQHPDWIARYQPERALVGMVNPSWGGAVWTLDTTHPDVLTHLEALARDLVAMGWRYLKLDFTYAPALATTAPWHDPSRTPAQRVRDGYEAIRRGAGDDVFILGCGAPLGACIGAVDGMRIGPDVAPSWHVPEAVWHPAGYEDCEPATGNAFRNTLARAFQHRRLWLNDPDCLMLRTGDTALTDTQIRTWAGAVAVSGGMALVSDDLDRVDASGHALLDEVITIGRRVDAAAHAGVTPRCDDLLDSFTPGAFRAGDLALVVDADGVSARSPLR